MIGILTNQIKRWIWLCVCVCETQPSKDNQVSMTTKSFFYNSFTKPEYMLKHTTIIRVQVKKIKNKKESDLNSSMLIE